LTCQLSRVVEEHLRNFLDPEMRASIARAEEEEERKKRRGSFPTLRETKETTRMVEKRVHRAVEWRYSLSPQSEVRKKKGSKRIRKRRDNLYEDYLLLSLNLVTFWAV
jgi:hypothetical protein